MQTFLALYRGPNPERATVVAVTADPEIVDRFASVLLRSDSARLSHPGAEGDDPVERAVADGRREALEIVREEAEADGSD